MLIWRAAQKNIGVIMLSALSRTQLAFTCFTGAVCLFQGSISAVALRALEHSKNDFCKTTASYLRQRPRLVATVLFVPFFSSLVMIVKQAITQSQFLPKQKKSSGVVNQPPRSFLVPFTYEFINKAIPSLDFNLLEKLQESLLPLQLKLKKRLEAGNLPQQQMPSDAPDISGEIAEINIFLKIYAANESYQGRQSLQRVLFQCPAFLELLQDQNKIKSLLASNDDSVKQIQTLMLWGFSTNLLAYLATAEPNWECRFKVDCIDPWKDLPLPTDNKIRILDDEQLNQFCRAIQNLAEVLKTHLQNIDNLSTDNMQEKISKMKMEEVVQFLTTNAKALLQSQKPLEQLGFSHTTSIKSLISQSTQAFEKFKDVRHYLKNNDFYLLSMGLVSHALDAKHLIGMFISGELPNELTILTNTKDPTVQKLMLYRLQQAALVLLDVLVLAKRLG